MKTRTAIALIAATLSASAFAADTITAEGFKHSAPMTAPASSVSRADVKAWTPAQTQDTQRAEGLAPVVQAQPAMSDRTRADVQASAAQGRALSKNTFVAEGLATM